MNQCKFSLLVVLFSLIWSSAFIAGKVVVAEADPFSVLAVRFIICSLLLLPAAFLSDSLFAQPKVIRSGLRLGILNNGVYLGLSFAALRYISPGWVTVIAACAPFMTIVLAALFGIEAADRRKVGGVIIGVSGVVVMTGVSGLDQSSLLGIGLAAGGTFALASATVLFRGSGEGVPLCTMNLWQSVGGALFLIPASLMLGAPLPELSLKGFAALGWLVFVTLAGMSLWLLLIRLRGAGKAASYHLLNPISALVLANLIFGTAIRFQDIAGAVLIGVGLLVSCSTSKGTKERTDSKALPDAHKA